jgi:hypothetical protein
MNTKTASLTLAALALIAFAAKADDYAWGSTTGASMVQIDATTGKLQSIAYNGTAYTNFILLNTATNNQLGSSLWLAQNANGTLYGLTNNGVLYTINVSALATDVNNDVGFFCTQVSSLGVTVTGSTFISSNLLDISTGSALYQYNLTTKATTNLGSFSNNANVSGLSFGGSLFGVQYSPSPGSIQLISGVNLATLTNSSFNGANGQSSLFVGTSPIIYLADGNSSFYAYNTTTATLTSINNNFPGGLHSLTPTSVSGGSSSSPTPTATPTPTASPTPTPTATPKIAYSVPASGALTVADAESTGQNPTKCAASTNYSVTSTASFGAGAIIDPNGTLAIYRYYQTTSNGSLYSPATLPGTAASPASIAWAWSSGSTNTHTALTYTAGQVGTTGTPFYYGIETLKLVYTSPGNGGTQTTLDTKTINLYPWVNNSLQAYSPNAAFSNALTKASAGSNPSPYVSPYPSPTPVFQGDAPRLTVQMNNLYPNGTSSVIIYAGTPSNPGTATPITVTVTTTPNGAMYTSAPPITFELAPYITASTTAQTYTIVAVQQLPAGYPVSTTPPLLNPAILSTVTFSTTSGLSVNGTVGTVK